MISDPLFRPAAQLPAGLSAVEQEIARACKEARRNRSSVTLVAVSKTFDADVITPVIEAGQRVFGENRVQEWEGKFRDVSDLPAQWHLIGHLQSNKAAKAAKLFHSIDSLHDFPLAQRLDRARAEMNATEPLRVLIEVHMGEETKSGVAEEDLPELSEKILSLSRLNFAGLMAIPPYHDDPETVRPYFAKLRELRDSLERGLGRKLSVLSMGMSHDFEAAIAEGATEVRVGTALFGTRAGYPGI